MLRRIAIALACVAGTMASAEHVAEAGGGSVRVLDKITGVVTDLELQVGQEGRVGLLGVTMGDCRYPIDNPSGNAYGYLTVLYRDDPKPAFQGWMIASAPALNAMDHPRYDVWMLRCNNS